MTSDEDIASLDETVGDETLEMVEVEESMCRTIGTFEGDPAICMKDVLNCKRHAHGRKKKIQIPAGK